MGKRGPCRFTERELARVLRAGESAGIPVQVNIARDGSLTVSPARRKTVPDSMSGTKTLPNRPFPFVHSIIERHGKRRHYFRRHGQKRVTLPGAWGSQELQNAYRAALAVRPRRLSRSARGVPSPAPSQRPWRFISGQWISAPSLRRPSASGGASSNISAKPMAIGDLPPLSASTSSRWLPEKRRMPRAVFLRALRRVVTVALRAGLCDADPTAGIRIRIRSTGGFRTWTEDDIAQFESFYPIGSRARLAFALLLYTGQRRGDVIRMGRQHVKGGVLTVHQAKTGVTVAIPIHPALQAALAASEHLTFLTTATGKPFTGQGFTNWFRTMCRAAGLPPGLSPHGLRKAMCRRLAEAGCSASQIAAISGHTTLHEVARYTKAADQKRMARDAIEAITGTSGVNPAAPNCKPASK